MHKICFDESKNLTVEYGPTGDHDIDFFIEDYLKEAGFKKNQNLYTYTSADIIQLNNRVDWIIKKFIKEFGKDNVDICDSVKQSFDSIQSVSDSFENALIIGEEIKQKSNHSPKLSSKFTRELMPYQNESVEHMIKLGNAANFSVPGSGKTTITYAAISNWLENKIVEKILVIGPTSSFLPWEEEYQECFNETIRACRITGQLAREFHNLGDSYDLFLMHFNTSMNRQWEIQNFMQKWNTVLIIDESHNIKSHELRRWASTALIIAPYAKRRVVLTGTPMPNNAKDLWTQITFLWPNNRPLGNQLVYNNYVKKQGIGKYQTILNSLFCRIKKSDLNLPAPEWILHKVELNTHQKEIYNAIAAKTLQEIEEMDIFDQAKLQKFRMARMIRLLQTASNPTMLYEMSGEFDVNSPTFSEEFGFPKYKIKLPGVDSSLIAKIVNYSKYELPSKIVKAAKLAEDLYKQGHKVLIWTSFIHNMAIFKNQLLSDFDPILINGYTPKDLSEPDNRDDLINEFKNSTEPKILIATAASLGESVSLHRNLRKEHVCNHAIYLERNFNGAQYMQSMDRIHRIGMDPSAKVEYHLIIGIDTIDEVVNQRLNEKWGDMLRALNDDMLNNLNIDPEPETMNEDEFNKDYRAVLEHLRKICRKNDN